MLRLIKVAKSDSESSFYDEATDYQLEDDGNDDRVLPQPGIDACHGVKGGFTGGPGGHGPPKRYDFTPREFELKRQPIHKLNM